MRYRFDSGETTALSRALVRGVGFLICLSTACGGDLTLPSPDQPAILLLVSGDPQEALTGRWAPQPLVVRVVDSESRPLAGVSIAYRFADEVPGSAIDPQLVESNAAGEASAVARLGSGTGEHPVVAQVQGTTSSRLRATFRLTALPSEGDDDSKGGDPDGPSDDGDEHGGNDEDHDEDDDDDD